MLKEKIAAKKAKPLRTVEYRLYLHFFPSFSDWSWKQFHDLYMCMRWASLKPLLSCFFCSMASCFFHFLSECYSSPLWISWRLFLTGIMLFTGNTIESVCGPWVYREEETVLQSYERQGAFHGNKEVDLELAVTALPVIRSLRRSDMCVVCNWLLLKAP